MQWEDKESLETTEFYNHRFRNFATMSIVPATLFLVEVILFLSFGQREITVRTTGEITPMQVPVSVQATVSSSILENHLREGQYVRKGDTLLVYHDVANSAQVKVLRDQVARYQRQLAALATLKTGLIENTDVFGQTDDEFGYHQVLQDYLSQRSIYTLEGQQDRTEQASTGEKATQVSALLKQSIQSVNDDISAYNVLLAAIQKGHSYPENAQFGYIYQNFVTDSKGLTGEALDKVRNTYVTQIQQQLTVQQESLRTLRIQQANSSQPNTSALRQQETQAKLQSLQTSQLKSTSDQKNQVSQTLTEIQEKLATLEDQQTDYRVKAPRSGTLHIDGSQLGKKYVPSGNALAEIYPVITDQRMVTITLPVSANETIGVKRGQRVRLRIARNVPTPITLDGIIKAIDIAPTITKNGNFFQVTARAQITSKEASMLRYGIDGDASIIVGKKTYLQYIVDNLVSQ
ncbi:bacteriocin secretion accessory protein [Schleiferilactobacillus shenzhenensis]|uniref:Bacteriocin secretion accessory protein n=1 Tax=Schleiferilactobacillus shenzhenensis LY-73 TaxID=1231336 RepID=U4TM04_9LACO|nr:bacteriocin secretion accessory protein [Schleiferilactobacillus shenzhenensis]ERL65891.1 hypothetical protein L248_1967 [Schleiferilactobacillus shenzhenensis LY-73]